MNIIFDLDGTIIDSSNGIYKAYVESIKNIIQPTKKKYFISKIGPPIQEIIRDLHPCIKSSDLEMARKAFRIIYDNELFLDFNKYEQIDKVIRKLATTHRCFVVTNKPTCPSKVILDKLDLNDCIKEVIGVDFYNKKGQSKSMNLTNLIKNFSLDVNKCIYIGDTLSDYLCAKKNRISFLGFKGGYYNWSINDIEQIQNFYNSPKEIFDKLKTIIVKS